MADHYRTLVQSLMKLGFLFRRQGVRKHEVWRNRLTDQEVTFDRQAVSSSRAAVAAVVKVAEARKPAASPAAPSSGKTAARRRATAAERSIAKAPAKTPAKTPARTPAKMPAKAVVKSKPAAKGKAKGAARRGKTAARSRPQAVGMAPPR